MRFIFGLLAVLTIANGLAAFSAPASAQGTCLAIDPGGVAFRNMCPGVHVEFQSCIHNPRFPHGIGGGRMWGQPSCELGQTARQELNPAGRRNADGIAVDISRNGPDSLVQGGGIEWIECHHTFESAQPGGDITQWNRITLNAKYDRKQNRVIGSCYYPEGRKGLFPAFVGRDRLPQ